MANQNNQLRAGQDALNRGDFAEAFALFQSLARTAPQAAIVWRGCSASLYGMGDFKRALATAKEAVRLAPKDSGGLMVLGPPAFVLSAKEDIETCGAFIKGLPRDTGETLAKFWSQRLSERDYFSAAADAYSLFAATHPEYAEAALEFGHLLLNASKPDECEKVISEAELRFGPMERLEALRARIFLTRGDTQSAKASALKAINMNSGVIPAYVVLSDVAPEAIDQKLDGLLGAALSDPDLPIDAKVVGHIARGKGREKRREFGAAFDSFAAAKALSKQMSIASGQLYDKTASEEAAQNLVKEYFSPPAYSATPVASAPITFIIGMPRSGSTLIDQIISRHSKAVSVGESMIIANISKWLDKRLKSGTGPRSLLIDEAREFYRQRYSDAAGAAVRIVDKNLFNFEYCGLIAELDPNARFIITERDPADIALSAFKTKFLAAHPWSDDLSDIAHMQAKFEFLADHWRRIFKDRVLTVMHEELVADFKTQVRAILEFCGLEFEEACLEFHKAEREVFTTSAAQVRRPINADGVGRWRNYETHLAPYFESLKEFRAHYGSL